MQRVWEALDTIEYTIESRRSLSSSLIQAPQPYLFSTPTLPKGSKHQDLWQHWSPFMVWDDPKLSDENGEVPKPDIVIGGAILGRDIVSLLHEKTS